MIATGTVQTYPGAFAAGRPAALTTSTDQAPAPRPRTPWSRNHLSFRGTRIFTALMLGWAGLVLAAFGGVAVPAANDLGRASLDAGLMGLLGTLAPALVVLGVLHVVAAFGVGRDRAWGFRLGVWMLAAGVLFVVGGLVFAVAGRDPFALADPASPAAANGIALLAWTLGLYSLAGWGLGRVIAARGLAGTATAR